MLTKTDLKLITSGGENRAVLPQRLKNTEYRQREHLTPSEVAKLIETAKRNRYGQRDATMILVAYRHGLRASEICDLEWSAVDFERAELHVTRRKSGKPATHPVRGDELRELRKLRKVTKGPFVFETERGGPFAVESFNHLVKKTGQKANLPLRAHAHMLRHACGYKLAGDGRHQINPGLPWPSRYSPYRALHRTKPKAISRFLPRLNGMRARRVTIHLKSAPSFIPVFNCRNT